MKSQNKYQAELKIGQMPKPEYLLERWNTSEPSEGQIKWIGMKAYSPGKEIKDFLWYRNFIVGNLKEEPTRTTVSKVIAAVKIKMNADTALGLPIDMEKSDPLTNHVEIVRKPNLYGLYVESEKRPFFNVFWELENLNEMELRRTHGEEFTEILRKAKEVLPYPDS